MICVEQVHTEKKDAGYLVELKWPADTVGHFSWRYRHAVCVHERRAVPSYDVALCLEEMSCELSIMFWISGSKLLAKTHSV